MWWCRTLPGRSPCGTWPLQASLYYSTTRVNGNHAVQLFSVWIRWRIQVWWRTYYYFHDRLAWDFSVGQLSSKVLKSSQLVSLVLFFLCFFAKIKTTICLFFLSSSAALSVKKTTIWNNLNPFLFGAGHLSGRSGSESAAVWRCEPTRHEAGLFVSKCEDTHGGAAWGTVSWSAPAAPVSSKKHPKPTR